VTRQPDERSVSQLCGPWLLRNGTTSVGDGLAIDNIDFEDLRLMAASPGAVFDVQIACEPGTDPKKKYKEATKMVDIFVFIVGVFELLKFSKIQLVLGSSTNI
jgi:hypothetical protein